MNTLFYSLKTQLLMVLLSLFFLGGASSYAADFEYGVRPSDGVFDPLDFLTSEQRKQIAEPLAEIFEKEGIDIMIILLPEISDVPAKLFADSFFEKWEKSNISAVVVYVPGKPEAPWIFPNRQIEKIIKSEVLKNTVQFAEQRARAEADDFEKIRAASIEAAEIMRYWTGGAILKTESLIYQREIRLQAYNKRQRLIKIAAVLAAAGAIPLIAGIIFVVTQIRKNSPRNFPLTRKITRLGAPYSGGNHAVSD